MKVESDANQFKPIVVTITIEDKEEMQALYLLSNSVYTKEVLKALDVGGGGALGNRIQDFFQRLNFQLR